MGFDLSGRGGSEHFNWMSWSYCLEIAHGFGWQPEGTKPNDEMMVHVYGWSPEDAKRLGADWDGGYFTNDFQLVTDSDAKALAAAFDRAISDGEVDPERITLVMDTGATRLGNEFVPTRDKVAMLDWLRALADYARQGGFRIG
jgi:hypothetical protein